MCGIAGYSLSTDSSVDRTLAAQALLAGIAERGAHAVGYAYRAPGEGFTTVVKQRTRPSHLLDRIDVPENAGQVLVHVRDYTKGHPSIPANNHPVRHGPVIGIHNGIITNDGELLDRREPAPGPEDDGRLGGDLRRRRALAKRRARARGARGRDGCGLARRARAGGA